jgi:hypothetical protein
VNINGLMDEGIRASGWRIICMGMESIFGPMDECMWEIIKMIKKM